MRAPGDGSACPRQWEAAAAQDGRLDGTCLASYHRHRDHCRPCQTEWRKLSQLRRLGLAFPVAPLAELPKRRLRQDLLRSADALVTSGSGPAGRLQLGWLQLGWLGLGWLRLGWLGLGAVGAAACAVVALRITVPGGPAAPPRVSIGRAAAAPEAPPHGGLPAPGAALAPQPPALAAHPPAPGAASPRDPQSTRTGAQGPIGPASPVPRAFVPSEKRAIARDESATDDGRRRALDAAPLTRVAPTAPGAPGAAVAPQNPPRAAPRGRRPSASPVPDATGNARGPGRARPVARGAPLGHPAEADRRPGALFGQAMAAFSAHDYAAAERLLERFETAHPSDARVEDAVFLRTLCRQALGDARGARRAAAQYLERFPTGFRRDEARALQVSHR